MTDRGQSGVVGVALLLGVTVVSLGLLTAGIGTVVGDNAARADVSRVAAGFEDALRPVEVTGPYRSQVTFSEGTLYTEDRDLRVLERGTVVERVDVDALVFDAGARRATYLAGAVVRGRGDGGWLATPPAITTSRNGPTGILVVSAPVVGGSGSVSGRGGVTATLATNVSHERTDLGRGVFGVAIETASPSAWEPYFVERGATVTIREFDGDGTPSVVAAFPGRRQAYLVRHVLDLEVSA